MAIAARFLISCGMKRTIFAAFALIAIALPAEAACTDPAGPKVNWRRCYFDGGELMGIDLTGAELRDATFSRASLKDAVLVEADAYRAKFVSAVLVGAKLDRARLIEADFTRAEMDAASLREADLRNAKLVGASLKRADFTGAKLGGADFRHADLTGATWVDGKKICGENSVGQCN